MRNWSVWRKGLWLETAVFLILFALALGSMRQTSPTFDEQGYITRGLGYLRGENKYMRVGHPLGLNALNAALLVSDETVQLPTDDPSWALTRFHRPAELFLWEIGNDVPHIMFLARLPTIWLGMLLLALIGRWVWELTHQRKAVWLAMALAAFDPNLLAHMRLATTDFGLTAASLLAGFLLWYFWQRPSWARAIYAGVAFGLLQNTKFTAGLFVPLFTIVIFLYSFHWIWTNKFKEKTRKNSASSALSAVKNPLLMFIIAYPLAAFLTLWAAYGFQIGVMPPNLPTFPQLTGVTLPLSRHLEQLLDIGGRLQKSTPAFLAGNYSDTGWWYYFPVAFLLKTPLPTLILLLLALFSLAWLAIKRKMRDHWLSIGALLIPPLGYFAIALTTEINLGYRHLLPTVPFLIVFIAATLFWLKEKLISPQRHREKTLRPLRLGGSFFQALLVGAAGWLIISTFWLYPSYLTFFNGLAGGPDGGWRYLVDSNLDWGQDLENLKVWMDENNVDQVWLSYFGEGRPSYYNINYIGLDSFPPRLMNPQTRPFYPDDPAPGIYAISATNLQGVQFANNAQFAWFREKTPLDKVGYSIFLYDVPPRGQPVDVLLAGVQLDEIAPADFAQFQTNQPVPRWLDVSQSFLQPAADGFWLVVSKNNPTLLPETAVSAGSMQAVSLQKISENEQYILYQAKFNGERPQTGIRFSQNDAKITFLDAQREPEISSDTVQLTTGWRNDSGPVPLKIFIHLLDSSGQIVAQWDGLGAAWEGWRAGDILWQQHTLTLPAALPPGQYQLRAGLYQPETGSRWLTAAGADFIDIGVLEIAP
jgi:Dolichyl-phosphate-mannose-protein mannosyltransferase